MADAEILYEVAVKVAPDARADYLVWLRPHIDALLALDGFLSAELFVEADDPNLITCQYRLRNRAAMEAYLAGPASEMRADGMRRFGARISAQRRIRVRLPL